MFPYRPHRPRPQKQQVLKTPKLPKPLQLPSEKSEEASKQNSTPSKTDNPWGSKQAQIAPSLASIQEVEKYKNIFGELRSERGKSPSVMVQGPIPKSTVVSEAVSYASVAYKSPR